MSLTIVENSDRRIGPDKMDLSGRLFTLSLAFGEFQGMEPGSYRDTVSIISEIRYLYRTMRNLDYDKNYLQGVDVNHDSTDNEYRGSI